MKINNDENYMQATQQLNSLISSSVGKNTALSSKLSTAPQKLEESKTDAKKNLQGGLESNYLDRTQPNRGKKTPDTEGSAKAKSKGAIAKLDVSGPEAEVKKLKQQLAKLQREVQAASGDENASRTAKAQLAKLEAEIKQKDNKNYKIANGKRTTTPM